MTIRIALFLYFGALYSCQNENRQSQDTPESAIESKLESNKLDGDWELFKVNDRLFSIENVYFLNYGGEPTVCCPP